MKKVILMTACTAAMLLSGCSDNELASVGDGIGTSTQSAIGFHVVGNQAETRATPITSTNIKEHQFNVYAFTSTGKEFMGTDDTAQEKNGINISYKGEVGSGKWDYTTSSDRHYWSESTPLNFYAVSPTDLQFFSWQISNAKKEIQYNSWDEYKLEFLNKDGVMTKVESFPYVDVMYAIATEQTKDNNNGTVKLQFRHITSQIVFKAKTELANMDVNIKNIKFYNFDTSGTFTIPTSAAEISRNDWKLNNLYATKGFTVFMDKSADYQDRSIDVSSTEKEISDGPMLLVPQKLEKWNTTHNITQANTNKEGYLEITCKIKQNGVYLFGDDQNYKTLYVPFGAIWEPGKRYTYTLIFGGGYNAQGQAILQPINFEAEVGKWEDADTTIGVNK